MNLYIFIKLNVAQIQDYDLYEEEIKRSLTPTLRSDLCYHIYKDEPRTFHGTGLELVTRDSCLIRCIPGCTDSMSLPCMVKSSNFLSILSSLYIHLISKYHGILTMRMRGHTACIKQLATSPPLSFILPGTCWNPNSENTGCRSGFHDAGDFLFRAGEEMKDMDRFASIRDIPRLCCKIAVFFSFFSGAFEGHHHFAGWQHRALQDFWGEFLFDCGVVPALYIGQEWCWCRRPRRNFRSGLHSGIWSTSSCHDLVLFILFHWYIQYYNVVCAFTCYIIYSFIYLFIEFSSFHQFSGFYTSFVHSHLGRINFSHPGQNWKVREHGGRFCWGQWWVRWSKAWKQGLARIWWRSWEKKDSSCRFSRI